MSSGVDLAGRTCLVVDGARGLGREIAREAGRCGADVVVTYRSAEGSAQAVADEITDGTTPGTGYLARTDPADESSVESLRQVVHESVGRLDVLVTGPRQSTRQRLADIDRADWEHAVHRELRATFYPARAFFPDVRDAVQGRLLTVSSVVGNTGAVGAVPFATVSSALFGFSKSLALELAPHESTANCLVAGFTTADDHGMATVEVNPGGEIPLGRPGEPTEVATVAAMLMSEESAYVTGEVLGVTGGYERTAPTT